jgi:molybdenum cofactor guanylyltransferase
VTAVPAVSAIVLAGGRSRRFGRDKLAEPLGAGTLLDRAVAATAEVAGDVVVLGRPAPAGADVTAVRYVADPSPFEGPLAALAAGLDAVREPIALVVGGDMPALRPDVLVALVRALAAAEGYDAAALRYRSRLEQLPLALRVGAATPALRRLVDAGERRLGAALDVLRVRELDEAAWRPLDPTAATLRDVDEPDDLSGVPE